MPEIGKKKISPAEIVVPLFGFNKSENKWIFLGTGVFCGKPSYLVTANHVLGDMYDKIAIHEIDKNKVYSASSVVRKPKVDLAILKIENYDPPFSCQLGKDEDIVCNKIIYSYEYGTTQTIGQTIEVSPATRMGNVTRTLNLQDIYGDAGDTMLELSFPALLGASGSPVVHIGKEVILWGIVVANKSYHLLPAQIEKVVDEDGSLIEETKYLLPQALAVNVKHIRQFITENKSSIIFQST